MRRRALGLFLLSSGVLLAEVVWTRLLSARTVHVFAFLAVSTAMLGTAVGARWAAGRAAAPEADDHTSARLALAFAVSVPIAQILSEGVGFELASLRLGGLGWLRLGALYLVLALPFALAGAAIALVLARDLDRLPQLYAADLAGAAAGALAALALVPWCRGPPALWLGAALGAGASAVLHPARGARGVAAVLLVAGVGGLPLPASVDPSKAPGVANFSDTLETRWTAHARLDRIPGGRGGRWLIDGGVAAVRIPTPGPISSDDAALVLALRPGGRVLVVGSGVGWEIKDALEAGARQVVGVEVNPGLAEATPAFLAEDPRVTLVVEDARSYLERTEERFDVVLMAHTITNAATAGGALGLTEDHMLTVEALRRTLDRRAQGGLLLVTRPVIQLPRLARTVAAAAGPGSPPAPRTLAWRDRRGSFFGALLVAEAWRDGEVKALIEALRSRGRILEHTPDRSSGLPSAVSAALADPDPSPTEAEPRPALPTDDRPFFHRRWTLGQALPGLGGARAPTRLLIEEHPLAELALIALLLESTLLGLAVGLWRRPKRARPLSPAAVGLAFMAVEIGLLGLLGLLLGDPSAAVAVGLAGLLVGTGAGSWLLGAFPPAVALGVAAGAAAISAVATGPLVGLALPLGKLARWTIGLILSGTLGAGLGGALPSLLRDRSAEAAATGWAINAAASVAGLALALLIAPELGLSGLMGAGAGLYLVTALGVRRGTSKGA
ncbi:MAG: methyltransferase domain-containing protein [Myxococcota bacterium]